MHRAINRRNADRRHQPDDGHHNHKLYQRERAPSHRLLTTDLWLTPHFHRLLMPEIILNIGSSTLNRMNATTSAMQIISSGSRSRCLLDTRNFYTPSSI